IKRSALHTYYSALPFTPSDSLLYRRYIKDAVDNLCSIEGGPARWDALVANMNHGERVNIIKFSLDSALFVSCSQTRSKIWAAVTGTPISTMIPGDSFALYNVKTHSFISTLPFGATSIAFSPDCTRLAVGSLDGSLRLLDIPSINTSGPPSNENATAVTALALSRDCSRLACGFEDGTVELWETSPTKRRLGSKMKAIFFRIFRQSRHPKSVRALGFDPNGGLFASGSYDRTIKLWNGGDGALVRGTLKAHSNVEAVALSNSVLVAAGMAMSLCGALTR
ncbi:hypothetical protein M378DRAFT_88908, partial [Amanita muscaria Koide BX008]